MSATVTSSQSRHNKGRDLLGLSNLIVLLLSVLLIVWISIDTFKRVNVLENHSYMTFQF